jgi:hypothetical protein
MIGLFSDPFIQNVVFDGNMANWGGAVYLEDTDGDFLNVQFTNNEGELGGGLLCTDGSDPRIINSTFSDNTALNGGSISCMNNSNPVLINSILWNPDAGEEVYFASEWPANSITISYSDVHGGQAGILTNDNGTVFWLDGNLDQDPLFIQTGSFPYKLSNESPAVNAGTDDTTGLNLPDTDLSGSERIYGGRVEMGAYENQDIFVGLEGDNKEPLKKGLDVFPNPFTDIVTVRYELESAQEVNIKVVDHTGRIVFEKQVDQIKGRQQVSLNLEQLPSGIYQCVIFNRTHTVSANAIKMK